MLTSVYLFVCANGRVPCAHSGLATFHFVDTH